MGVVPEPRKHKHNGFTGYDDWDSCADCRRGKVIDWHCDQCGEVYITGGDDLPEPCDLCEVSLPLPLPLRTAYTAAQAPQKGR